MVDGEVRTGAPISFDRFFPSASPDRPRQDRWPPPGLARGPRRTQVLRLQVETPRIAGTKTFGAGLSRMERRLAHRCDDHVDLGGAMKFHHTYWLRIGHDLRAIANVPAITVFLRPSLSIFAALP